MAKFLILRLQTFYFSIELLRKEQIGFLQGEEELSQTVCLIEICQLMKMRSLPTILSFPDLNKIFDMVPHKLVLQRLVVFGLAINFIKIMYENQN